MISILYVKVNSLKGSRLFSPTPDLPSDLRSFNYEAASYASDDFKSISETFLEFVKASYI